MTRNKTDVRPPISQPKTVINDSRIPQYPIKAGHEFILSTNDQYKDICDDKVMYVDYVSTSHLASKDVCL